MRYLRQFIRAGLCTQISCTTCGATDFRRGLVSALQSATGRHGNAAIDREGALLIAEALASLDAPVDNSWRLEEAVRLALFDIWYAIGVDRAERVLQPIVEGTWAGDVLARMKAHYEAREAARRAVAESQDPVRVQKSREDKRRIRQERHAERLARKKERDRLWHEWQREKER